MASNAALDPSLVASLQLPGSTAPARSAEARVRASASNREPDSEVREKVDPERSEAAGEIDAVPEDEDEDDEEADDDDDDEAEDKQDGRMGGGTLCASMVRSVTESKRAAPDNPSR